MNGYEGVDWGSVASGEVHELKKQMADLARDVQELKDKVEALDKRMLELKNRLIQPGPTD